jgi:CheY-like chemotaxis protein
MEEERTELLRREREASRLKDEFLATISHELRTPLNAILGWSRMLASGVLDAASSQRALETIERNARSQAHLIEDLLDISRIMSGRMRLDVRPLDLRQVIDSALDAVRPAADAKQIAVDRVFDPAAASAIGDPDRLQQVFWNLLSNAVKFTPEGQRIEVRLRRANAHVEVVVSDTGQGIEPGFLPHVFDSFRQADSTSTRQHGGLGLGLAIVRHLVELHGGSVSASSRGPGQGAAFTVELPVYGVPSAASPLADADAALPPVHDIVPPGVEGKPLDRLHVLVVEDELDTLLLLQTVLTHYGAEVRGAGAVGDALAALDDWPVDVVVSDIGLPGEDGYSFIERLRSRAANQGGAVPAIALTAYARSSDRSRAMAAGFQLHIAKPVEPADLVSAIERLARGSASGAGQATRRGRRTG